MKLNDLLLNLIDLSLNVHSEIGMLFLQLKVFSPPDHLQSVQ